MADNEADEPALISMKRSKAEMKAEAAEVGPGGMDAERYPWGLCLSLDKDEIEKLGITKLPGVGDTFEIYGMAKVASVSANASETGDNQSMRLQITDMCLEPADEADNKVASSLL